MEKRKKLFLSVALAFAVLFVFSAAMLLRELRQTKQEAETFAELAALRLPREESSAPPKVRLTPTPSSKPTPVQIVIGADRHASASASPGTPSPEAPTPAATERQAEDDPVEPTPLPQYLPLYEQNSEFFGWITIPDTNVDYPVMYSPTRPLQYLDHDFYGKASHAGVPFLDADCDPKGNFYLVYGHRMRNKTMFGGLLAYEDSAFWETHPTFRFDTRIEERTYTVVVAMRARVLDRNDTTGFRYYEYTSLSTKAEFEAYMEQARQLALYDTGVETAYGDEILVLSTCYHYTNNGRFVIVAKRVADG